MDIAGLTEAEIYSLDPELIDTAYTVENDQDTNYGYTVNRDNQAKRLMENAKKAAYNVTYKDFKSIDGNRLATNANVEFNAGLYMSAIKPALMAVHEGWKTVVFGTSLTCHKLSNRMDKSGNHLVCTQLTLLLTNMFEGLSSSKVVMHFYHTDDKLQVQGSSLLSRVSTAEWMVEHFIKPLATQHLKANNDLICSINREILSGKQCCFCKAVVNHSATNIKDQTLPCNRCNRIFHKRCTDRRNARSNWRRQPWFCQYCILNSDVGNQIEEPPKTGSDGLNTSAQIFQPSGSSQLTFQPAGTYSTSANIHLPPSILDNHPPGRNPLSSVPPAIPSLDLHPIDTHSPNTISLHPSGRSGPTQLLVNFEETHTPNLIPDAIQPSGILPNLPTGIQAPRFPTTSTRQRSSNVNVTDAEAEFNKTALNSCRSTITQQEAELKRLNECLVIRNKRILQLELQIGHASDMVSSRDGQDESHKEANKTLLQTVERLVDKISQFQNTPSTNIVVNSCQSGKHEVIKQTASTQTQDAGSSQNTTPDPIQNSDEITDSICEICVNGFANNEEQNTHIQETHNHIPPGQNDELPDENPL